MYHGHLETSHLTPAATLTLDDRSGVQQAQLVSEQPQHHNAKQ